MVWWCWVLVNGCCFWSRRQVYWWSNARFEGYSKITSDKPTVMSIFTSFSIVVIASRSFYHLIFCHLLCVRSNLWIREIEEFMLSCHCFMICKWSMHIIFTILPLFSLLVHSCCIEMIARRCIQGCCYCLLWRASCRICFCGFLFLFLGISSTLLVESSNGIEIISSLLSLVSLNMCRGLYNQVCSNLHCCCLLLLPRIVSMCWRDLGQFRH